MGIRMGNLNRLETAELAYDTIGPRKGRRESRKFRIAADGAER
jgi:hypothetical protein